MSNADGSQITVDEFLAGERQAIEALVRDYGLDVVGKLERVLLRDLIYERGVADRAVQHAVLITLRMQRADVTSDAHPPRGGRQRFAADLKRWTERAMQGLLDDLLRRGAKIRERFWITPTIAAELSSAVLFAIAARSDVAHLATIRIRWTTRSAQATGAPGVAQGPHSVGYDGKGVRVAILDTGVAVGHPALAGRVESQQDFTQGRHGTFRGGDSNNSKTNCRLMTPLLRCDEFVP